MLDFKFKTEKRLFIDDTGLFQPLWMNLITLEVRIREFSLWLSQKSKTGSLSRHNGDPNPKNEKIIRIYAMNLNGRWCSLYLNVQYSWRYIELNVESSKVFNNTQKWNWASYSAFHSLNSSRVELSDFISPICRTVKSPSTLLMCYLNAQIFLQENRL